MNKNFDYDLFVIGAGSGGVRCARTAAGLGARVAIAEERYLGGTCVNVGCVPKKLFVYASQYSDAFAAARGFGWDVAAGELDWRRLRDNKTVEIERLNRVYESLLEKADVTLLNGTARITGPQQVEVAGRTYRCEHILVATGGWPNRPKYPGRELVITSNEVFFLDDLPKRVLVEGGGYIAVEFAGIFKGLGCSTELVHRGPLFLRGFDEDISHFLAEQMRSKGVSISFNTSIERIDSVGDGVKRVTFGDGRTEEFDLILSAIGRHPRTQGLGLKEVGVETNPDGTIVVDERFRTSTASIFALGDVVGRLPLTPVALREGTVLAHQLFGDTAFELDYEKVATAVFSQPEMATVGLSEQVARQRFAEVEVFVSQFKPMKHALSGLAERSLMKLVVNKASQRVLGCHMVGDSAGEIMQGIAIAVGMGATKADFDKTLGIHPTAAEEFVTMR